LVAFARCLCHAPHSGNTVVDACCEQATDQQQCVLHVHITVKRHHLACLIMLQNIHDTNSNGSKCCNCWGRDDCSCLCVPAVCDAAVLKCHGRACAAQPALSLTMYHLCYLKCISRKNKARLLA
jgi:hypothetical protein